MRLRPAWKVAITAVLIAVATTAYTTVINPPGLADHLHSERLAPLLQDHLATVDNRLQEAELYGGQAVACPTAWNDELRDGRHAYSVETTVVFAHYSEARGDWVPTCDEDADYYAITLTGSWPGAIAPMIQELAADRYINYAAPEADQRDAALAADASAEAP